MSCDHQVMNRVFAGAAMVLVLSAGSAQAQPPTGVQSHQKISEPARRADRGQFLRKSVRHQAAAPGQPRRL